MSTPQQQEKHEGQEWIPRTARVQRIQMDHEAGVRPGAVRMSNLQYSLMKYFCEARAAIGLQELSHLNQLTVGACQRRGWLTVNRERNAVMVTREGREVPKAFERGDFLRSVARMKFSKFLDLRMYEEAKRRSRNN